jgi:phosphate starvation-inducible membrane PsiE
MAVFITTSYTVLIVASNLETKTQSNLFPPGFDFRTLTTEQISSRVHGSKLTILIEQMQIAVIWLCKTCLLILYHRLTRSVAPKSHTAVKLLAIYVFLGFLAMEILYFTTWCRPFPNYWSIPPTNRQCTLLTSHRITNAILNISSDLIMLCIALSLSFRSLLPLKRKIVLYGVFSIGIFAIIAAVLNKYYSFTQPYGGGWVFWYTRESSTAVIVANLPFTWTLLRRVFKVGAFDEGGGARTKFHSSRTAGGRRNVNLNIKSHVRAAAVQHSSGVGTTAGSGAGHSNSQQGSKGSPSLLSLTGFEDVLLEEARGVNSRDFAAELTEVRVDKDVARPCAGPVAHGTARERDARMRVSPDGTGGHVPVSPRRAHLDLDHRSGLSRPSSMASTTDRPSSLVSTQCSSHTHVRGGGRSATDRRKRARISG